MKKKKKMLCYWKNPLLLKKISSLLKKSYNISIEKLFVNEKKKFLQHLVNQYFSTQSKIKQ